MWRSNKAEISFDEENRAVLNYKNDQFTLDAGQTDDIEVYEDKERLFVLTENPRYGYVGLNVFDKATKQELCDAFVQNTSEYVDPDGRAWNENWAPWTKIRTLMNNECEELAWKGI